jgi:hypothetical protein
MDHRLAGFNEGGKMEDAVEGFSLVFGSYEKVFKRRPISQLPCYKLNSGGQQVAPSVAQIVVNNCGVSVCSKEAPHCTTYVPRASCYQNLHKKTFLSCAL